MDLLEINNLNVDYTAKSGISGRMRLIHAINGIDLSVKKGEILAIAGESGCGKSTLAKAVMKLIKIKNGEILFENKNITTLKSINDLRKYYKKVHCQKS